MEMAQEVRIKLTDTLMDVMMNMSDGNPGAISALADLSHRSEEIDPDSALRAIGGILALDTYGIYGTEIYILWNDQCGKDTRKLLILLRATQMGKFSVSRLKQFAEDQMRSELISEEEWSRLDKFVCDKLPSFQRPE